MIMVAATTCMAPEFSRSLFLEKESTLPNLFLSTPTKYGKYLRLVLAIWMVNSYVDVSRIVPTVYLETGNIGDISSHFDEENTSQIKFERSEVIYLYF